ncbi:CAIB/BAIF family protein [Basidiobolus meristosporus CBS 931.73]|uniref:CAIB/BAIF family protein n=1 Tax=Basidiobolus meristosporus CBS 931.73 TaxID=1314790 RepID=A0A1Y1Z8I3_9FUNG|nr:CAIB/BAIF family protein [Basidiobolus meristosporus CBS 931.73]|eukprot:ORY06563.1 CAIB/BAIF family protein [Basidiobolus meristosporus CBS 931.73]
MASQILKRQLSTGKIKPLRGIRVLEMGQLIAGPFTGTILGYYGAEVIKVEPIRGGDPIRVWRDLDKDGVSPWFRSLGRNKKSCTIDLKTPKGQELVKQLAEKSDVLIENFRPNTMEKWGLGPDEIYKLNPDLIYTRVSGYGQTGPYSSRPGFASVCEGMGGFRYVNGFPGEAPVRPNMSLGDSLAGLHAAFGVLLGLIARDKLKQEALLQPPNGPGKTGQVVDVAIYESVFNMMESIVPDYDRFGKIREASGTTLTGIVPTNVYQCKDGKYVIIGGNGDSIYKRLMTTAGRPDLTTEEYGNNADRVQHQAVIDGAISSWTKTLTAAQVLEALDASNVPSGRIYNAKDIVEDDQYNARNMIETVDVNGTSLKIPAITPKLSETPGSTEWAGPNLGQHNREVFLELLGIPEQEANQLVKEKIIGGI